MEAAKVVAGRAGLPSREATFGGPAIVLHAGEGLQNLAAGRGGTPGRREGGEGLVLHHEVIGQHAVGGAQVLGKVLPRAQAGLFDIQGARGDLGPAIGFVKGFGEAVEVRMFPDFGAAGLLDGSERHQVELRGFAVGFAEQSREPGLFSGPDEDGHGAVEAGLAEHQGGGQRGLVRGQGDHDAEVGVACQEISEEAGVAPGRHPLPPIQVGDHRECRECPEQQRPFGFQSRGKDRDARRAQVTEMRRARMVQHDGAEGRAGTGDDEVDGCVAGGGANGQGNIGHEPACGVFVGVEERQ